MNRKEIEDQYTVENGIIQDPGQFESEPIYVPYFVDFYMNGDPGEESDDDMMIYDIESDDIKQFPELKPFKTISIWQSEQGFWYHELSQ